MEDLYPFVFRGLLTEESLDKANRKTSKRLNKEEELRLKNALSYEMLEKEALAAARRMSIVYTAIHSFENMVRSFVKIAMAEKFEEEWWDNVSTKIKSKVSKRMDDEAKFRWHGARGGSEIEYCDFGDLSSIIIANWEIFEDVLVDLEWSKSLLGVLERSRNIAMHGGVLSLQDIERIGNNIRDWIRQTG